LVVEGEFADEGAAADPDGIDHVVHAAIRADGSSCAGRCRIGEAVVCPRRRYSTPPSPALGPASRSPSGRRSGSAVSGPERQVQPRLGAGGTLTFNRNRDGNPGGKYVPILPLPHSDDFVETETYVTPNE
jgi:hypothetical protein